MKGKWNLVLFAPLPMTWLQNKNPSLCVLSGWGPRWPEDEVLYKGTVTAWDSFRYCHSVKYDDGDIEVRSLLEDLEFRT